LAVEKLQKYAKKASKKQLRLLMVLEGYYEDQYSLGYAAKRARVPLRGLMEFMQKYALPNYSDVSDAENGLKKISKLRSQL